MLPMRQLIVLFFLLSSVFNISAQRTPEARPDSITAKASILQQKYCRADADLFTLSLKLRIEVVNSSKSAVYLLWPMVPWVGKVASGVGEAESQHFLYEQTASRYPQGPARFDRLKIESGNRVTVQSGYDLIVRHDPVFSYPKSISAGTYAVVLVLKPEEEPPSQILGPRTVNTLTTYPFVVHVPIHPKLVECDLGYHEAAPKSGSWY